MTPLHLQLHRSISFLIILLSLGLIAAAPPPPEPPPGWIPSETIDAPGASVTTVPPQYLIISADLFAGHLAPFIELKQSQGFAVTIATLSQTGSTKEQIKEYIQDLYNGITPPDYLLLVGDNNFIPVWPGKKPYGGPTDLYYATMATPPDDVPDIYYGRVPVRNTIDLDAWIAKMLDYEQASGHESWAKGASFLATNSLAQVAGIPLLAYQVAEYAHNQVINLDTGPNNFIGNYPIPSLVGGDKLYAKTYFATHENVVDAINAGRALVVYSGDGLGTAWVLPEFTQTDVREMTGPPVILAIGLASNTANFNSIESLGDTWITQDNSGSLAYIGSSGSTQYEENGEIEKFMFERLFSSDPVTARLGPALENSLQDIIGFSDYSYGYPEIYQLFGDPSLQLIRQPKPVDFEIDVSPAHIGTCSSGTTQASVTINGRYDFNQTVTLDVSGLPAGLTAEFSPNPIAPYTPSVLTLDSLITTSGDFPLAITGTSGSLSHQSPLLLSIHNSAPLEVALLAPPPFTPNAPLRPILTWTESQDALSYDLQIASDHLFTNLVVDVSGLTKPTFTPSSDLARGANYWWRVRAVNACGSSAFTQPERFTTLPAPGTCTQGDPQAAYSMNFDTSPTGWDFISQGPWELSMTVSHSPGNSAFARSNTLYAGERSLISSQILVPAADSPIELSFWSKHVFENTLECRDGGLLDISIDNGVTWGPIDPDSINAISYDGVISSAHQNPLGNQLGWCGTRDWSKVVVSLDAYAGKAVKLRWSLGIDNSSAEGVGWYIDDVAVSTCAYNPPPGVQIAPQDSQITGLAGQIVHYTLDLTNTGPEAATFVLSTSAGTWLAQVIPAEIWLAAGSSAQITIDVAIPDEADPGSSDRLVLYAFDKNDHAVHAQADLTTRVSPYRIELSTAQLLKTGLPGMGITFEVLVVNSGILGTNIDLSIAPPIGWAVGPLVSPIFLDAGASMTILATVFVPADALAGTLADFTLEAVTQEDSAVKDQLAIQVQVVDPIPLYLPIVLR